MQYGWLKCPTCKSDSIRIVQIPCGLPQAILACKNCHSEFQIPITLDEPDFDFCTEINCEKLEIDDLKYKCSINLWNCTKK